MVRVQPLAPELPHVTGVAKKKKGTLKFDTNAMDVTRSPSKVILLIRHLTDMSLPGILARNALSCAQVPPASPSSPGPQEPEKGERRTWTVPPVAVALKPALQQSREARHEELPGGLPVLCSPSSDLSLLLGPTFQSQHSFQPLEPKPDLTSSSGDWGSLYTHQLAPS